MKLLNKKAKFNYSIVQKLEAGVVLSGSEVKAVRSGKVDFTGSHVKIIGGELFLINLHIGADGEADSRRSRKVLVAKKEILALSTKTKALKLTLIPLSLYTKRRLIKLEVALVQGKKQHEKRTALKQRDIEREIEQELKNR